MLLTQVLLAALQFSQGGCGGGEALAARGGERAEGGVYAVEGVAVGEGVEIRCAFVYELGGEGVLVFVLFVFWVGGFGSWNGMEWEGGRTVAGSSSRSIFAIVWSVELSGDSDARSCFGVAGCDREVKSVCTCQVEVNKGSLAGEPACQDS